LELEILISSSPYSQIILACRGVLDPDWRDQYLGYHFVGKSEEIYKLSDYHSGPNQLHRHDFLLSVPTDPIFVSSSSEHQNLDQGVVGLVT
jgi:hypothetical protein